MSSVLIVGSLTASTLARRGFNVKLYEQKCDIRTAPVVKGKSINLALSERGRSALRLLNLEEEVLKNCIPMKARLIHDKNGNKREIAYGKEDQFINSVGRRYLNEILLNEAEKYSNLKLCFNRKLVSCDFDEGKFTFASDSEEKLEIVEADVIIGADGAHSAVRREMIERIPIDFSQIYIEHGYMELCIKPNEKGDFAIEANFLHIWPRGSLMMIALPNLDRSFTVTLFMPFKQFDSLKTSEQLFEFFETNFKDAIALIGKEQLAKDFFSKRPNALISVKCKPYNFGKRALLIGDAAHAMVPFFGQGMNCGFEDCFILNEILDTNNNNLKDALPEFTRKRNADCFMICDLAMYNYVEMRELVNNPRFLLRKKFDSYMHSLFGRKWIPFYSMVTFTRIPYYECVRRKNFQDKLIALTQYLAMTSSLLAIFITIVKLKKFHFLNFNKIL
ncbi:kynurenine 3-monooxygenase-like protein [Dinothrombium tinctorium]|uniref:Kynurenine 3-monooxygenase n=1 Tax=Dinothrombium tinctorium TaxID=1965070 RepID=A0A3S3S919_9ACAR|nr:kynurenine 3-monooxygenase-like protein [Dinothrombium tinctorium]